MLRGPSALVPEDDWSDTGMGKTASCWGHLGKEGCTSNQMEYPYQQNANTSARGCRSVDVRFCAVVRPTQAGAEASSTSADDCQDEAYGARLVPDLSQT